MSPEFPGQAQYLNELQQAETANRNGNKGKARVYARRAAGILVGEYLRRRGIVDGTSAYDRLKLLESLPDISEEIRAVTSHFLLRINLDRSLPIDVDLIAEARWLEMHLLAKDRDD